LKLWIKGLFIDIVKYLTNLHNYGLERGTKLASTLVMTPNELTYTHA